MFSGQGFWSVQLLSRVQLFATPWHAAHQASLSITNSRSLLKLTSIKSVMPSSHLILCRSLLLPPSIPPSIRSFPMSQLFASGGQRIGLLVRCTGWRFCSFNTVPLPAPLPRYPSLPLQGGSGGNLLCCLTFFFFYCRVIALQCGVSLCCTTT